MTTDLLADCMECGGRCRCPRCHGLRWVYVTPAYADRFEQPARPGHRAALLNTMYPCKDCNAGAFYRWSSGCLEADHDAFNCDRCQADHERPRRGNRRAAPGRPPLQAVEAGYRAEGPDHD